MNYSYNYIGRRIGFLDKIALKFVVSTGKFSYKLEFLRSADP